MRYGDIVIGSLDMDFIEKISDKFDVDYYEAEIYTNQFGEFSSGDITNQVIYYILSEAVYKNVKDEEDQELLLDSIYTNCLDSGYNIERDKLGEEGKKFLDLWEE